CPRATPQAYPNDRELIRNFAELCSGSTQEFVVHSWIAGDKHTVFGPHGTPVNVRELATRFMYNQLACKLRKRIFGERNNAVKPAACYKAVINGKGSLVAQGCKVLCCRTQSDGFGRIVTRRG